MKERQKTSFQTDGKGSIVGLCRGLLYTQDCVLTLTNRTKLPRPLNTGTVRPIGLCNGSTKLSVTKTSSEIFKLVLSRIFFSFPAETSKYFVFLGFENAGANWFFQCSWKWLISLGFRLLVRFMFWTVNKCAGNQKSPSSGSSGITATVLEIKESWTWQNRIVSYGKFRTWRDIVRVIWPSARFVPASHKLPNRGAWGGKKSTQWKGQPLLPAKSLRPSRSLPLQSFKFWLLAGEISCIIWFQVFRTTSYWLDSL